uniref:Uncharacterized protein n=1 Tax=Meloidogyne javanica TaxID=6303 RepID=A0A915MF02_MELJA
MLSYEYIYDDAIYKFFDNCYYEEEEFEEYCFMDKMSTPINAKFDTSPSGMNCIGVIRKEKCQRGDEKEVAM